MDIHILHNRIIVGSIFAINYREKLQDANRLRYIGRMIDIMLRSMPLMWLRYSCYRVVYTCIRRDTGMAYRSAYRANSSFVGKTKSEDSLRLGQAIKQRHAVCNACRVGTKKEDGSTFAMKKQLCTKHAWNQPWWQRAKGEVWVKYGQLRTYI